MQWGKKNRRNRLPTPVFLGFPCGSASKESACNAGDLDSIPGLGRSPGEGKGYPLQYSGLENSMDCIVHWVAKSLTLLSDFHSLTDVKYLPLFWKILSAHSSIPQTTFWTYSKDNSFQDRNLSLSRRQRTYSQGKGHCCDISLSLMNKTNQNLRQWLIHTASQQQFTTLILKVSFRGYFLMQRLKSKINRTSPVEQWIRIYLPMQGTWVWSPVQEDSICRGVTKPMCHNYWSPST